MKTDAAFLRDFHRSHAVVSLVAAHLVGEGMDAWIRPPELRPSPEVRQAYSDAGDIGVLIDCQWMRVEVKSRSFSWTGSSDFPYPDAIVDEAYHIDREGAGSPLLAYAIVASDLEHMLWIPRSTRDSWTTKCMWDVQQKRHCDFLLCPLHKAEFISMRHT